MSAVSYKRKYLKRLEEVQRAISSIVKGETEPYRYSTLLTEEALLAEFLADLDHIIGD